MPGRGRLNEQLPALARVARQDVGEPAPVPTDILGGDEALDWVGHVAEPAKVDQASSGWGQAFASR
jgi:hypothetical protein